MLGRAFLVVSGLFLALLAFAFYQDFSRPWVPIQQKYAARYGQDFPMGVQQIFPKVQVNSQYAHASEEVLGAALHYELGKQTALKAGLPEADAKAAGLLMAAKCLDIDTGNNDEEAWKAVLKFNGLPATITHEDAMAANHHYRPRSATAAKANQCSAIPCKNLKLCIEICGRTTG